MNRAGAALVLALLVLLVLEGVVLGAVYLTVQERRVAHNGLIALRLRLAAESAARRAAGLWPSALDSLAVGELARDILATTADGLALRTVYQRIDSTLFLVFAEAGEPPPRAGRARAALLVQPPLLTDRLLPDAAIATGAAMTLGSEARLSAISETPCPDDSIGFVPDAVRMPDPGQLAREPGAVVEGATRTALLESSWPRRIAAVAAVLSLAADSATRTGVIAIIGDLTIPATATVRGVVLVDGALMLEAGAVVSGLVVATGPVEVHGTIRFSACDARHAIRDAGLNRPRAYGPRATVPAF
jgi:hypothetical protein